MLIELCTITHQKELFHNFITKLQMPPIVETCMLNLGQLTILLPSFMRGPS
jgi:hypothetical protein